MSLLMLLVMPGHSSLPCADRVNLSAMPGIHVFLAAGVKRRGWPGTGERKRRCPSGGHAGLDESIKRWIDLAPSLPDQNQSDHRQRRAVIGPLDLADHEARLDRKST